jgi:hypothetical protein
MSSLNFRFEGFEIKQLIPGDGWNVLLAWMEDGQLKSTITPVVAWALLENSDETPECNEVAPVILHPTERLLTWDYSGWGIASQLVQPGCQPTTAQEGWVKQYAIELKLERKAYAEKRAKARRMRREGDSFEHIAEVTGLSRLEARQICQVEDEAIRLEKQGI